MGRFRGFTLIELLVVITIIGILAGITLPNYLKAKDKAKEAECKANLHVIQAALEQYATDKSGTYPQYLIGGDQSGWLKHESIVNPPNPQSLPPMDPLMAGGYLTDYPHNPFVDDGLSTTIAKTAGSSANAVEGEGDLRFGWTGNTMGNTLDDPRYLWSDVNTLSNLQYTFSPNSTVGPANPSNNEMNPFFTMGGVPNPEAPDEVLMTGWWEGQFFYRSIGDYIMRDEVAGGATVRNVWDLPITTRNRYYLGVYGSNRTRGQDVIRLTQPGTPPTLIRDNSTGVVSGLIYRPNPYGGFDNVAFSSPEVMGGGDRDTMPYFPPIDPAATTSRIYGAPDGYPDGVIATFYPEKESSEGAN
ncbi:MAG: type II secretion system protein [bacterium]